MWSRASPIPAVEPTDAPLESSHDPAPPAIGVAPGFLALA
jgi:hypothetical protein